VLDISLQALTLDQGSSTTPREPFGAAIDIDDVAVAADGTFQISIPMLFIDGSCNPITGSDVDVEDLVMDAQIVDESSWCGTVDGNVTSPIETPLTGSTFAATAFDGALPLVFPVGC